MKITDYYNLWPKIKASIVRRGLIKTLAGYRKYFNDLGQYKKMEKAEQINTADLFPILSENIKNQNYDSHYLNQGIWAYRKIFESKINSHVDIGSQVDLVSYLTAVTKVTYIDIRPLLIEIPNYESHEGSILSIPYQNNSVHSLSCLHVAEHIGLGRYGDPLDPQGTVKACKELSRVLAIGGNLYFSLPIGMPKLYFNAHRIHSPFQIMEYFKELKLIEFSAVNDEGKFIKNVNMNSVSSSIYACGMFHFTK